MEAGEPAPHLHISPLRWLRLRLADWELKWVTSHGARVLRLLTASRRMQMAIKLSR